MMKYARGSCESWLGLVTKVSSSSLLPTPRLDRGNDCGFRSTMHEGITALLGDVLRPQVRVAVLEGADPAHAALVIQDHHLNAAGSEKVEFTVERAEAWLADLRLPS